MGVSVEMSEAPADAPEPHATRKPRSGARKRHARSALKASVLAVIAGMTAYSGVRLVRQPDASPPSRSRKTSDASVEPGRAARSGPLGSARASSPPIPLVPPGVRHVFIGGGATPESTEVSLEQDMALAQRVLGDPGIALFAGGSGTLSVRELDPKLDAPSLRSRIGDIFHPRIGRTSRYRASPVPARPALRSEVERTLTAAFGVRGSPLTVYVAAHGEKGDEPRSNYVALWGEGMLTVERLAELHDASPRPLRFVSATCFSGGFAELAFERADEKRGPTEAPRCGLFAATWDREASGCDPNPDRRQQESYSLHVLHALARQDRDGKPLPAEELDIDGDGAVGLLEAHTRARVASRSIDVPTTTSERLLRSVEHNRGAPARDLLPEDARTVDVLSRALGLANEEAARLRWETVDAEIEDLDHQLDAAEEELDARFAELRALVLGHWPVLDDPYHAYFERTLAEHAAPIAETLEASPEALGFRAARERVDALDTRYFDRLAAEAMLLRLVRAHETLALAGALRKRPGRDFEAYRRLLVCERGRP